ncbi:MAG: hypothetical protein D6702_01410 [Planctomycetota bacterium]|nr:MAG: hypothetical protein D6702_01410 [Planctomycetota bacterium]
MRILFRHAPSLAGGPLRLLNGCLAALAEARRRGGDAEAVLLLDEELLRPLDRKLLLIDAQGNPVRLPGPENGRFDSAGRAALAAAAVDAMPPTAEAAAVVDRLLPAPGAEPLAAEAELWRELLGPAGLWVETRPAGAAGPPPAGEPPPLPEATWFGPRHLEALARFGVEPAAALAGEESLRAALTPPPPVRLAAALDELDRASDRILAELEQAVQEEEPALFGAWCRLRREVRRSTKAFHRRVDRSLRNRDGIRGSRLRALAQGLRPLDGPQQDGLGLVAAAALFGLDLDRLEEAIPSWQAALDQDRILVEAAAFRVMA